MRINQPWQRPINVAEEISLDPVRPFDHTPAGRITCQCPISGRTEGTVRMEGRLCSFCMRPVATSPSRAA